MRKSFVLCLLLAAGCGNSSTNADGRMGDMTSNNDLTMMNAGADMTMMNKGDGGACGAPDGTCGACIQANCSAQIATCIGANWQTMEDPNAPCHGLYACICACDAQSSDGGGSSNCFPQCVQMAGETCQNCVNNTFLPCFGPKCQAMCK